MCEGRTERGHVKAPALNRSYIFTYLPTIMSGPLRMVASLSPPSSTKEVVDDGHKSSFPASITITGEAEGSLAEAVVFPEPFPPLLLLSGGGGGAAMGREERGDSLAGTPRSDR